MKLFGLKVSNFFKHDVWRLDTQKISKPKAFYVRSLRIFLITLQGFSKRQIQLGASSLVYYTLLALVPIITLLLGIAKGFHIEDFLAKALIQALGEQKEVVDAILKFAQAALKEAQSGVIAAIGFIVLFWSAIKILRNIESVFNRIWEVRLSRSIARQFSDYLAMILICPVIVFIASAATIYLSAIISTWDQKIPFFEWIGPAVFFFLNLIPYFLTWVLFTFIYIFIPNTRVKFVPALISGIITGTVYQLIQAGYVYLQIGVSRYNAIYGTFAAFPLFLIWVHLSWIIVLLGGKIVFASQNVDAYEFISEKVSLSQQFKAILALRISHLCIRRFCEGFPPLTPTEFSNKLSIPLILTSRLLYHLTEIGVLSEVKMGKERISAYQPARPIEQLTIKRVLDMMNESGEAVPLPSTHEVEVILGSLKEFSQLIENSDANLPLKDI